MLTRFQQLYFSDSAICISLQGLKLINSNPAFLLIHTNIRRPVTSRSCSEDSHRAKQVCFQLAPSHLSELIDQMPFSQQLTKGSPSPPKWMNFRKISKRPLTPPPLFRGKCCDFLQRFFQIRNNPP